MNHKKGRVLITGGAGYIGSSLAPMLLEAGNEVVVLDRFYFGDQSLAAVKEKYGERLRLQKQDVRRVTPATFADVDMVVDLAGISNDPACELNPELTREINHAAAVKVARCAREAGVSRLVFASSCSVYGHGESLKLTEKSPLNPVSLYAHCKVDAERDLFAMADQDFEVTALRFATVFGISHRMRFDLAINIMTRCAYVDRVVRVDGGGKQWRPFVHVKDVSRAIQTALEAPSEKVSGQVFNVGANRNNLQIRALAFRIRDRIPGTEINMVPSDPDIRNYNVAFDRIHDELGFDTQYSIEDGIDEVREALASGALDPDDRRWYTLKNYLFLEEVERVYEDVAIAGRVLTESRRHGTVKPEGAPTKVDFYRHGVGDAELASVAETFQSLFLTCGPRVAEFEREFGSYLGSPNVVGVTSCSMGLLISLKALGVGPGDEVITTPMTFASTSNAILHLGATPVFADVDPSTGMLDPGKAEEAVTRKTKAVIVVHLYGQLAPMTRFRALADRHDLALIEDAAHAIEARRDGIRAGTLSDMAVFSFYATKTMTSGDGGAIAVRNPDLAARLRRLRNHGITKDAAARHGRIYSHWDMVELGYKCALTDIQAAILLPQLPHLDHRRRKREALVEAYEERLRGHSQIELVARSGVSSHHLFTVKVPAAQRDVVLTELGKRKIGCAVNYRAVHTLAYYRDELGFKEDAYPLAADWGNRTVSLPLYPDMPLEHVDIVCDALLEVLSTT